MAGSVEFLPELRPAATSDSWIGRKSVAQDQDLFHDIFRSRFKNLPYKFFVIVVNIKILLPEFSDSRPCPGTVQRRFPEFVKFLRRLESADIHGHQHASH